MLAAGKAIKIIIYVSEGATHHGAPIYASILDYLFHAGVSGATVTKGIAGFGTHHRMHSTTLVDISDHLPLKVEFIESRERVDELLPKLQELCGTGMIEMQETLVVKGTQAAKPA